jgi:hypothetical protein
MLCLRSKVLWNSPFSWQINMPVVNLTHYKATMVLNAFPLLTRGITNPGFNEIIGQASARVDEFHLRYKELLKAL